MKRKSLKKAKRILVVAAHPDDELLGLAGTLCLHRDKGDQIYILILSNGENSRGSEIADSLKRLKQARKVARMIGAKLFMEDFPDNAFDSVSLLSIAQTIEKVMKKVNPHMVYTHHSGDLNIDHTLTSHAVMVAFRPVYDGCLESILTFETLSSTEWQAKDHRQFAPNHYIDISSRLEEKKKLLSIYADELREYPHSRSLEGVEILSKYRGMESGLKAAEAFQIIRTVKKTK